MTVDLNKNPFYLDKDDIKWVKDTLESLSTEEKLGQLLCPGVRSLGRKAVRDFTEVYKVGAIMTRPMPGEKLAKAVASLQEHSRIPMLIAGNLEAGGNGVVSEGTLFSMPMGATATGDMENGYRLGKISCQEAAAAGVNWAFAPIIDIDNSYRNPITNVRAFSSDKDQVITMASGYLKAAKEENVAVSIKHFPGDGCDERDHHLHVTVNNRSYEEWMDTYGEIYKSLIKQGAQTVMSGHIAQPAIVRKLKPGATLEEAVYPASQSGYLINGFLRDVLGFNGVVITDSSLMVGYMQKLPRRKALPLSIMSGVDMILFNRNVSEDLRFLKTALENGELTYERLDEAVLRILALKAHLKLHKSTRPGRTLQEVLHNPQTMEWVKECADKCVTLVKDKKKFLPLSPAKTKRVYLNVIESSVCKNSPFAAGIKKRLEKEGFEVTLRNRDLNIDFNHMKKGLPSFKLLKALKEIMADTDSFVSRYDMCMLVVNMETVSNATTVRINWKVMNGLGNDIPWYAGEMPCVVVSTANPYHLLDIPMADVYINTYTGTEAVLDAMFEKIMGRSEFKGVSPVDPFCGHEDTYV